MKTKKFTNKTSFIIIPTSPFHFDSTFYKPGHFPSGDTKWEPGKRWQTMFWPTYAKASEGKQGEKLGVIFEDRSTKSQPKRIAKVFSKNKLLPEFLKSLKKEIIWRYNLDLDLSDFYKSVKNDPILKSAIKKFYGLRPMSTGSLYEYLIVAIVLQNATVKRSVSMMQSLFENYGKQLEFDGKKFWDFWQPEVMVKANEEHLRKLKLGYRAKSLIRVSEQFVKYKIYELKLRKESEDVQEQTLLSLYGIGPASCGYIMLDVFHRWNYLKHISPWEQKIYTKLFFGKDYEKELVPVSKMLKYFSRWGKWKNLAIHYVWEEIWWRRKNEHISWLEKLIRL